MTSDANQTQQKQLFRCVKLGIIKELHKKQLITDEQFKLLMKKHYQVA